MFLYFFVEKDGNHELHGAECAEVPAEIVAKQTELTNAAYNLSDAAKYEAQVIHGATAGWVLQSDLDAANERIAELEKQLEASKAV